jgi:hypothetical protein
MPVGIGGKFVEPPADVLQRCEQFDACFHVLSPTTCAKNCSVQVVMEVELERATAKALSQRKQRYCCARSDTPVAIVSCTPQLGHCLVNAGSITWPFRHR